MKWRLLAKLCFTHFLKNCLMLGNAGAHVVCSNWLDEWFWKHPLILFHFLLSGRLRKRQSKPSRLWGHSKPVLSFLGETQTSLSFLTEFESLPPTVLLWACRNSTHLVLSPVGHAVPHRSHELLAYAHGLCVNPLSFSFLFEALHPGTASATLWALGKSWVDGRI